MFFPGILPHGVSDVVTCRQPVVFRANMARYDVNEKVESKLPNISQVVSVGIAS